MTGSWTAAEIRDAVAAGRVSAREVCEAAFAQIERHDGRVRAFLSLDPDGAFQRAARLDLRADRDRLPLAGVPIAVKDNICTRTLPTTAASRIIEGYVPPYEATVVSRLTAAGAIVVGKTNCDEFAMGSSTENSGCFPTRNPWDETRAPGGSSGGSAAAVAARMVPVALGSDTGGSVRQPAGFCGVVGLKPTYGRVSRYGLLAFGSSLDQVGPFARTVRDAALLLQVMAGPDPQDATSAGEPVPDYAGALDGDVRGLRIGVPAQLLAEGVDEDVAGAFRAAVDTLRSLGAIVSDVTLPHARFAIPVYYLVATAEASSNLARYDGVRYGVRAPLARDADLAALYDQTRERGFGAEVKRRIMLGTYVLSAGYYDAFYLRAQQVRTLIRRDYEQAFERVDVIALPTSPTAAFRLGERTDDPLKMYLADVFTVSANLAGICGVSVPCGFGGPPRLPVGLQLLAPAFGEATLLRAADAYERATPWASASPSLP
ncbi:MAG: Asp-tRNA(Asn)/Glu-tRNA(Gln) amidotransferase subunit GatA [Vicinamibacterales bacterium]|nr:Asp-tRNA(Asn)/Glu-tRNA(Gln) amidotransferase subunit GatA [Vicinamibacterales bacterium]